MAELSFTVTDGAGQVSAPFTVTIPVGEAPAAPTGMRYSRDEIISMTSARPDVRSGGGTANYVVNASTAGSPVEVWDVDASASTSILLYGRIDARRVNLHDMCDGIRPTHLDSTWSIVRGRKHRRDLAPSGHFDFLQFRKTDGRFVLEDFVADVYVWANAGTPERDQWGYPSQGNAACIVQSAEGPTTQGMTGCVIRRGYVSGGNYCFFFTKKSAYSVGPQQTVFSDIEIGFDTCRWGYTNLDTATFQTWENIWLVDPITRERIHKLDQPGTYTRNAIRALFGLPAADQNNAANPNNRMMRPDGSLLPVAYADMV